MQLISNYKNLYYTINKGLLLQFNINLKKWEISNINKMTIKSLNHLNNTLGSFKAF